MSPASNDISVIKLGGSLLGSPQLGQWLLAISGQGQDRVVTVPGGGHYADAVRAQETLDEEAAHYQAFLAMRQVADDFIAINPAFKRADSLIDINAALNAGGCTVAVPIDDWRSANDITASWDYTSDSLALWLAAKLGATRLLLVKSVMPTQPRASTTTAVGMDLIDRFVPMLKQQRSDIAVYWAGREQHSQLSAWLAGDTQSGFCELV